MMFCTMLLAALAAALMAGAQAGKPNILHFMADGPFRAIATAGGP
jgi:hypothetical protein